MSVCIATDSAKISRLQPFAFDNGVRNKPNDERGPKPIIEIRQPQTTITAGVRQLAMRIGGIGTGDVPCMENRSGGSGGGPLYRRCLGRSGVLKPKDVSSQTKLAQGPHPLGAWHTFVRGLARHRGTCYMGFARNEDNS